MSFRDTVPFEHFNVLVNTSYSTTSVRTTKRMEEALESMELLMKIMRADRTRAPEKHSSVVVMNKEKELHDDVIYQVLDGNCMPL